MTYLAALMAIIPLSSSAECLDEPNTDCVLSDSTRCMLNGVVVPGDPEVIEGTRRPDVIDCSRSCTRHEIYGNGGADEIYGSDYDDFIAGGDRNDTIHGCRGDDNIDGGAKDDLIHGGDGDDVIFGGVGSAPASGVNCELQLAAAVTTPSMVTTATTV